MNQPAAVAEQRALYLATPWPVIAKTAIQRYLDGERIEDIAKGYGVTRIRLYKIIIDNAEDEWKGAQMAAAVERLEDAKQLLDEAERSREGLVDIARARESAKIAQWDLERVCRRIYGTDQPPSGQGQITINIGIGRAAPLEVDITPTAQSVGSTEQR